MEIHFLTGFSVFLKGRNRVPQNKKMRAILLSMALKNATEIERPDIANLLWSESDAKHARASLRNVLFEQQRAQNDDALILSDRRFVRLNTTCIKTDFDALMQAIVANDAAYLERVKLNNLEVDLFSLFFGLDPSFDEFLTFEKQRILQTLIDALHSLLNRGDVESTKRPAAHLLRMIAPFDEFAVRYLMQLDYQEGNIAQALRHYETLWNELSNEMDIEPSLESQALAVKIKSDTSSPQTSVQSSLERSHIVVQPFENLTGDPQYDRALRAIRSEIIDALCWVREWVVIDQDDLNNNSKPLDNVYQISGRAIESLLNKRLVITAKSLNDDAKIVWNGSCLLDGQHILQILQDTTKGLSSTIVGTIYHHKLETLSSHGSQTISAYDQLMLAKERSYEWTPQADRAAEEIYRQIDAPPDLALRAKLGTAELINGRQLVFPGSAVSAQERDEALSLAQVCYTGSYGYRTEASLALAWASILKKDYDMAAKAALNAVDGSLNNARRLASCAECLALSGHLDTALELDRVLSDLGVDFAPRILGYRITPMLIAQNFTQAHDRAMGTSDSFILAKAYAAIALYNLGDQNRAREALQAFITTVQARWFGTNAASVEDVLSWFQTVCPMPPNVLETLQVETLLAQS